MKRKHRKRRDPVSSDKKQTTTTVIIWSASLLIAVIFSLIIGNLLGKSSNKINTDNSVPTFSYTYEGGAVPPVKAQILNISSANIQASIDSLRSSVSAVSLYLRRGNGAPAYKSLVSSAILNTTGSADLLQIIQDLHKKDIYVSACFDSHSFEVEDKTARDAAIAFEAAMIAEIADAGVDDIVILGLPVNDAGIAYASELFKKIREINPNAVLGAAIDYKHIMSPNGAAAVEDYSKFADFCAVDASNAQSNGTSALNVANSLLYAFEVYPLRLLIGVSGDADFEAQSKAIKELGITNIQAYKYLTVSAG